MYNLLSKISDMIYIERMWELIDMKIDIKSGHHYFLAMILLLKKKVKQ